MKKAERPRSADVPIPDSYWLIEGQLLAGEYPGHLDEDEARQKLGRMLDVGLRSFVDLTETLDPLNPYDVLLKELAVERVIEVRYKRLPIRDMSIPTEERMTEILQRIASEISAGRPVYVHCWGGKGRTGTVAGCWLIEQGFSCKDAFVRINQLRAATPDAWMESPQTDEQRDFVRRWRPRGGTSGVRS